MSELILGFAKFNPGQGVGNAQVKVYSDKHTGRIERTKKVYIETLDGKKRKQVIINQAPSAEFVSIQENVSVENKLSTVTITGFSNSNKLSFHIGENNENKINIQAPQYYTVNGIQTENGFEIEGDPGALNQYEFSITIEIPENTSNNILSCEIIVTDGSGNTASTVIIQSASESYIEIDKEVINLDVDGNIQYLNITSNTDWIIKQMGDD